MFLLCHSFPHLIFFQFSSVAMITFYILSTRFFLKRKGLSDARVTSVTKKIKKVYGFAAHFLQRLINLERQYLMND